MRILSSMGSALWSEEVTGLTKLPGFDCPACGTRIGVTLEAIAQKSTIVCPNCSTRVSLDRDEVRVEILRSMKAAIDCMMDETRTAVDRMKRLKDG